jgi:hypothetical protein
MTTFETATKRAELLAVTGVFLLGTPGSAPGSRPGWPAMSCLC